MPSSAVQVSNLADAIQRFQRVFSRLADGTAIQIGAQYLHEPGPGHAPKIVLVPDETPGGLGGPEVIGRGFALRWEHSCSVHVRAAESGDDADRLAGAYALAERAMVVFKNLDPGHIVLAPGGPRDNSPLRVPSGAGAGITFRVTYVRHVPQDPAVLRALRDFTPVSPSNPDQPAGDNGKEYVLSATADAERE